MNDVRLGISTLFCWKGLVVIASSKSSASGRSTLAASEGLTIRTLVIFYAPLAASFFLTIITHSLFNAGLARLPSPEIYIAAFAVARSLMHVFESPMIMISQTVAALVEGRHSYGKVRNFTLAVVGIVVGLLGVFSISGLGRLVFVHVMSLTGQTLEAASMMLLVFIVFPCTSALKFFMQGTAIRLQKTGSLTLATVVRIVYVLLFVANMDKFLFLPPPVVAGLMFISAIALEGVFLWASTKLTIPNLPQAIEQTPRLGAPKSSLTYPMIISFFAPLIVTSVIRSAAMPIINIGLARTAAPELTLSAFAVAWGLAMIIQSPSIMFHQVTLSYAGNFEPARLRTLKLFAAGLGLAMALAMLVLSLTNGAFFILTRIIGASETLSEMAVDVLRIASVLPLLMIAREFYWGLLAKRRLTKYLGYSKMISIAALSLTVALLSLVPLPNPAIIGAFALIVSEAVELVFVFFVTKRNIFGPGKQLASEH